MMAYGSSAWSNDGNDSFVSREVTGFTLDTDGRYIVDFDPVAVYPKYIVRIAVSGDDLAAGLAQPIGPDDPEFEIVVEGPVATPGDWDDVCSPHCWNPAGTQLAIGNLTSGSGGVYVWDVASATSGLLHADAVAPWSVKGPHSWSPDGSKILLQENGNIMTINPDGTNLKTLLASSKTILRYENAKWSPNGNWIVYHVQKINAAAIGRIPAAGGSVVEIRKSGVPAGWFVQ